MFQVENSAPTMLLIFDGFGYRKELAGNAIAQADMKTWRELLENYPSTFLSASGSAVGLPGNLMGNSEVGHLCIGAGRVLRTPLCKFHEIIDNKSFFSHEHVIKKFEKLKETSGALHLLGLASDAGVHSHEKHMYALIELAKQVGIEKVFLHVFLDGRDTLPKSAEKYLQKLESFCEKNKIGKIASIHGRFYAMDRDDNWDRIQKSYNIICGLSSPAGENRTPENSSWRELLQKHYEQNQTEEFFEPKLLCGNGFVKQGDGMFFFNFRPDRAHLLASAFLDPEFQEFKTCDLSVQNKTLEFVFSTTRYRENFKKYNNDVLFEDDDVCNTLLDVISEQTKNNKVFIIAETEKYAHVTYFFRGKRDVQLDNETRVLIPSKKVKSYVETPEMSAPEITQKIVNSLKNNPADFYLANYANCDMVGHSGDFQATVQAALCLDEQLKILIEEIVEKRGGTIFITSDHGNAEEMLDIKSGGVKTSHAINPVPFVIVNKKLKNKVDILSQEKRGVACVAPTILRALGLKVPEEMEPDAFM